MGFEGLVLTDALRMRAISEGYGAGEAAIMALEAGADVILAPADVWVTLDAVEEAVESGRISRDRLDASVRRVLEMKARVGLHRNRRVNLDRIADVVGSRSHRLTADSAATRAITLPRDRDGLLPLDPRQYRRVLHLVYARDGDPAAGRALGSALGSYFESVTTERITPSSLSTSYGELTSSLATVDLVVVSAFVPPRAGAGEVGVPDDLARFVAESTRRRPTVVVSLGNPYLLSAFPDVGTYLVGWGPHEVTQRAAARALVGQTAISGTLPISLPPFHARGEGLQRVALAQVPRAGAEARQELEVGVLPGRDVGIEPQPEGMDPFATSAGKARNNCRLHAELIPWVGLCEGVGGVVASPLEVRPAEVGFDPVALAAVDSLILAALADSASPGAALAIGRDGKLVRLRGYGSLDWGPDAPPATPASLWDMASVTKVSATTTAAMILVEEGRLDLDAPVVSYLPWWAEGDLRKEEATVRQLLLHRAGLPPFRRFFETVEGKSAYQQAIGELPLDYPPGERTVYSDIGLMTVAFVVEEVSGQELDRFLEERVWDRLGMQDTGFRPDPALLPRIAPTEVDTTFRHTHVHGVVHDENAFAIGGVAGHAGLFSSARDMAVLAQTLLNGGMVPGCVLEEGAGQPCSAPRPGAVRIAAPTSVELFTRRHDATSSRALGWDTYRWGPRPEGQATPEEFQPHRVFGHTGFTGTSIRVHPESGTFIVLLTSRTNPTRTNSKHVALRREVHEALAGALTGHSPGGG
jgi:CubicO group peptidase (beta-lactamase class C family)